MPILPILFVALFATTSPFAEARLSPSWIDAPAFAPNVRLLIHETSAEKKSPASFVAIQKHSASEPKIKQLLASLKASGKPVAELEPGTCYRLKRGDLKTRQTWCWTKNSKVTAFVEQGPVYMSENELTELQLSTLAGEK